MKFEKNEAIETLIDTGLTENEAEVYLACLSMGATTAINIARNTEIKRPTVYNVIENLKKKGLVSIEVTGFKSKFVANDPSLLENILDSKRKKFTNLLPELEAMKNNQGESGLIRYYEGMGGVKTVYESMIRDIKPHEDYCVLGNVGELIPLDRKFFDDFMARRAKLPINIRILVQRNVEGDNFKKYEKNLNAQVRYLPEGTNLNTNLVIIPARMLIHELTNPIKGIIIENKRSIAMQKELFEIIWKVGEEE
jgi:sugar-specific transcriptional regulator TrmB